jgi:hypothetical protein
MGFITQCTFGGKWQKMAYLLATSSSSDTSMKGYDPSDHISHKSMPKAYTSDLLENLLALMDSGAIHLQDSPDVKYCQTLDVKY